MERIARLDDEIHCFFVIGAFSSEMLNRFQASSSLNSALVQAPGIPLGSFGLCGVGGEAGNGKYSRPAVPQRSESQSPASWQRCRGAVVEGLSARTERGRCCVPSGAGHPLVGKWRAPPVGGARGGGGTVSGVGEIL